MIKKTMIVLLLVGLACGVAYAHLCDDVFRQAKDNLAVKVDVRDGQLRISEGGQFNVYLLNTMDRDIADIDLEVLTEDFEATVKPSPEWVAYPCLQTINPGTKWQCLATINGLPAKKEYFEVALKRKPGTQTGKYKIGLRLFSDIAFDFLTIENIDDALTIMKVPGMSEKLAVDGHVSGAEWRQSLLCASFHEYDSPFFSSFNENEKSDIQTRIRFSHGPDALFCMIDFRKRTDKDVARIFIARDQESKPVVIVADLQEKKAWLDGKKNQKINARVKGAKMEMEAPLDLIGLKDQKSFYVNMTRQYDDDTTTYWRGNKHSVMTPMVYANFVLQ